MSLLISRKFHKKLFWLKTLEELEVLIPLSGLNIPDEIHDYNTGVVANPQEKPAFKFADSDEAIPFNVRECCDYIEEFGS